MQNFDDEGGDELAMKKQLLDELMQFAQGGMARDMRQRFGKPMDEGEVDPDAMQEDPEIPGVEASEGMGESGELGAEGEEASMDPEKLKALLASMGG